MWFAILGFGSSGVRYFRPVGVEVCQMLQRRELLKPRESLLPMRRRGLLGDFWREF